ncbi:MAG: hypothetical protein MUF49_05730 [Oculatellaceae cyanobacterium Prado106]|jgi:hypothetical protein|nr:hypothetical protein [Oculatellaceae cyanobacterium Prado106]
MVQKRVSKRIISEDGRAIAQAESVVITSEFTEGESATVEQSINVEIDSRGTSSRSSSSSKVGSPRPPV